MYSNYDVAVSESGIIYAHKPGTKVVLFSARSKQEFDVLQARLEVAYCNGTRDGEEEEKHRMKWVLGLL